MREIGTQIEIDAGAATVWAILTDLASYEVWNPFITEASGVVTAGGRLSVRISPPTGSPMSFRPTLTSVEPERELRWLGRLLVPGVFDGEHIFELSPTDGGSTRFVQREEFRGVLVPLLWGTMARNTKAGFEAMNVALKQRAEEAAAGERQAPA